MPLWRILFSFFGRIPRKTYWLGMLVLWAQYAALSLLVSNARPPQEFATRMVVVALMALWLFGFVLACLAVSIKRLHDRNKSTAWLLLMFVPILGQGWLFIELGFLRGTAGPNRYGDDGRVAAIDPSVF